MGLSREQEIEQHEARTHVYDLVAGWSKAHGLPVGAERTAYVQLAGASLIPLNERQLQAVLLSAVDMLAELTLTHQIPLPDHRR